MPPAPSAPQIPRMKHQVDEASEETAATSAAASPVAAASAPCPAPALAAHVDVAGTAATFVASPEGRLDAPLAARSLTRVWTSPGRIRADLRAWRGGRRIGRGPRRDAARGARSYRRHSCPDPVPLRALHPWLCGMVFEANGGGLRAGKAKAFRNLRASARVWTRYGNLPTATGVAPSAAARRLRLLL